MDWRAHFADILVSGDADEIAAAANAAAAAQRRGASRSAAAAEGKAAARRHRSGGPTVTTATRADDVPWAANWPTQLATHLFEPPARWGWQAAEAPVAAPAPPPPPAPRPVWTEPPHPDTSGLRTARSKAVSRLLWRVAFLVVAVSAFTTYQFVIEADVARYGGDSATRVYQVVLLVVAAMLVLGVLRATAGVRAAGRAIRLFEQPYLALRSTEQERHRRALRDWETAVREHQARSEEAARTARELVDGPLWYPVAPASEPTRVDVLGGDPRRHGWASLLATLGSAVLAGGHRVTVIDLTGQDVGGGLLAMTATRGLPTRRAGIGDEGSDLDLLGGLAGADLADCLADALTGRRHDDGQPADRREERALVADVLRQVADCLTGRVTFARLAAAVRVLRQGTAAGPLSPDEVDRLVAVHIGDVDRGEWTARRLRLLAGQLDGLAALLPTGIRPVWTGEALSVIETSGRHDDRSDLVDRLLVRLARHAMDRGVLHGFLVVAGVDHLGSREVRALSDHARRAGVRLVLLIDQPQGELERATGTGGAVCVMKMYNHKDATVAAEFIGRGHRFVISQVTRQVGRTFTDGGGDSFAASTTSGTESKLDSTGLRSGGRGATDSRGHTWSGTRSWQSSDNIGTSSTSARVYEFVVEPHEIMGLPDTAFILVDNSGNGRRITMADGNPGICLLDRVSPVPAP